MALHMKKIKLLLVVLSVSIIAKTQVGFPDPAFGTNGAVLTTASNKSNLGMDMARKCYPQVDGKLLLVIEFNGKTMITRRLANGNIDPSYAQGGYSEIVNTNNCSSAMQADGKILVSGIALNGRDILLARYNVNGTLDQGFGNQGISIADLGSQTEYIGSIAVNADGMIYTGGSITQGGITKFALARFMPSGQFDPSFGQNGIKVTGFDNNPSYISSLAIASDGKIIALGTISSGEGGNYGIVKYKTDGTLDESFNGSGMLRSPLNNHNLGISLAVSSDGKIYAGGDGNDENGFHHFQITRYNADGTIDLTYNNGQGNNLVGFGDSFDQLTSIRLLPDGKLLAAGVTNLKASYDVEITRLNNDGTLDIGFGINGLTTSDIGSSGDNCSFMTSDENGNIFAVGYNDNSATAFNLDYTVFRYLPGGAPDPSFGSGGAVRDYIPTSYFLYGAVYKQADGKLLATGTYNDGAWKSFLSRLNTNGTVDNSFGLNGTILMTSPNSYFIFQTDGKLISCGASNASGTADLQLERYNQDGTKDNSFGNGGVAIVDYGADEYIMSMAIQPDGKILLSAYTYLTGAVGILARLNADGTKDNSFGTNGSLQLKIEQDNYINGIAVQPDGKILVGGQADIIAPDFSYVHYDVYLARFTADGIPDNSFGQNGVLIKDRSDADYFGSLRIQADGKILYSYSTGTQILDYFAERLNADGSTDNSFGQNGIVRSDGWKFLLQADQKIILGGYNFDQANNLVYRMKRLNTDGSLDNSFGTNGSILKSFIVGQNFVEPFLISGNSLYATGYAEDRNTAGIIGAFTLNSVDNLTCPVNKVVSTDIGLCTAKVTGIDPVFPAGASVKYKLTGATKLSGTGSASGKVFNNGVTTVAYTLANDVAKTCIFTVAVQDRELPLIQNLSASPATLWPADHNMKDIYLAYNSTDNCGIANLQLTVSSNEAVQSGVRGDLSPDWQIVDAHHIRLRAERLETGNGRLYSVKVSATDLNGNVSSSLITVNVPKTVTPVCVLQLVALPNPSHNYFLVTVLSSCKDLINVRVMDNGGNVLARYNNLMSPQLIRIGDRLLPGVYYVEATQGGVTKSVKLIKL